MKKVLTSLFLLSSLSMEATELSPWFGRDFELRPQASVRVQTYREVQSPNELRRNANDSFYTLGMDVAALGFDAQFEMTEAVTGRQHFDLDAAKLTVRYQLADDIIGESFSLVPGISYIQALRNSLLDPSSFHHGLYEAEFFLSFGKEMACEDFWTYRFWGMTGLGIAEQGSPWIRGDLTWEKNWWNQQQLQLFIHSLWGLGGEDFSCCFCCFKGYGPIHHQSVDLGTRYSYLFDWGGIVSLECAYRVYARNFPKRACQLVLKLEYPTFL